MAENNRGDFQPICGCYREVEGGGICYCDEGIEPPLGDLTISITADVEEAVTGLKRLERAYFDE